MRERGEAPEDEPHRNKRGETAKEFMDKLADDGALSPEVAESAGRAADNLAKVVKLAEELLEDPANPDKNRAYAQGLSRCLDDKQDAMNILGAGVMAIVVMNRFGGEPKFKI